MKTITQNAKAEICIKKSTFIAHLCLMSEFKNTLSSLKKQHPKAAHFVYAYRFVNETQQIIEHKSDDNEPKGSSGQSVLKVLKGAGLVNVAVIVVRYFGGVKLGIGGLVRSYAKASNEVLQKADFISFALKKELQLQIDIKHFARIKHKLLKHNFEFISQFQAQSVLLQIKLTQSQKAVFKAFLSDENACFNPRELGGIQDQLQNF